MVLALIFSGIVAGLSAALGSVDVIPRSWQKGRVFRVHIRPALPRVALAPLCAGVLVILLLRYAVVVWASGNALLNSIAFLAGAGVSYEWAKARGRRIYAEIARRGRTGRKIHRQPAIGPRHDQRIARLRPFKIGMR